MNPFTPEYITMAKAAEEIQAGHHEQDGNYFYCENMDDVWIFPNFPDGEDRHSCDKWLPRLDQLLGMLGNAHDFARFLRGLPYEELNVEETGECRDWHELALAVVMREKYGKAWTGTEWRKV